MVYQTRERLLLPPVPLLPLSARQVVKTGQVLPAGTNFPQLKFESLMLDTG